jgi:hypothetical protein
LGWDCHVIEVHERKEKKIRYEELGEIRLDFELLTAIDSHSRANAWRIYLGVGWPVPMTPQAIRSQVRSTLAPGK